MTVSSTSNQVSHIGNGVTTSFPFSFKVLDADDLKVYSVVVATGVETLISAALYTVTGLGEEAGGTVTYPLVGSPVASTHKLKIVRELEYLQEVSIPRYSEFFADVIEDALDKLTMMIQQLAALISETEVGANMYVLRGIGGTADAVTASTGKSLAALTQYDVFWIKPTTSNTGPATIAIDGITGIPIVTGAGVALAAGEFNSAFHYGLMAYNSPVSELRIISEQ